MKAHTRMLRIDPGSRVHKLHINSPLPAQEICLSVSRNKEQLYKMMVTNLTHFETAPDTTFHTLVVTGADPVPIQMTNTSVMTFLYVNKISVCLVTVNGQSVKIRRADLQTTHEQADIIVVQQAINVSQAGGTGEQITVRTDDTDIFVLLLHFYDKLDCSSTIYMEYPKIYRTKLDIQSTARKHKSLLPDILAIHALSGCDSVAALHGIGKGIAINTALSLLEQGYTMPQFGQNNAVLQDIVSAGTKFYSKCYGFPATSVTKCRQLVWAKRAGNRSMTGAPKLASLPPTNEAAIENMLRSHLTVMIWKETMSPDPPNVDPCQYGFEQERPAGTLIPRTVEARVSLAVGFLLQLIQCGCSLNSACKTMTCTCTSGLSCFVFCSCSVNESCCCPNTVNTSQND